jgi:hypothetical protein
MKVNVIGYVLQRLRAELARVGSWMCRVLERAISGENPPQCALRADSLNQREPMLARRGFSRVQGLSMFKVTTIDTVHVNTVNVRP